MFCYLLPFDADKCGFCIKVIQMHFPTMKGRCDVKVFNGSQSFKFCLKNIEPALCISSVHSELRWFIFSYYVSMNMVTFACHALMVPSLLRRPRKGLQGPRYHVDSVELAVI